MHAVDKLFCEKIWNNFKCDYITANYNHLWFISSLFIYLKNPDNIIINTKENKKHHILYNMTK